MSKALNTQSGFSSTILKEKRKTLKNLVNPSDHEVERQAQSNVNFMDAKWKIHTSKILDNNKLGIGSVLKSPTRGINNSRDPNEFFKTKGSVEEMTNAAE